MSANPNPSSSGGSMNNTQQVDKVFQRFDANGDGKISASELADVMRALGSPPSDEDLHRMMDELDKDRDGYVNKEEFAAFHGGGGSGDVQVLRDAFDMYDQDRDGLISARELHRVLRGLGDNCSVEDCSKMIQRVDDDGDGCVNFEEFKNMMSTSGKRAASTQN